MSIKRLLSTLTSCVVAIWLLPGLTLPGLTPVAHASFGLHTLDFSLDSQPSAGAEPGSGGPPDVQAGSRPFQARIAFSFNLSTDPQGATIPDGAAKDLRVELPPGLIGSLAGIPQCPPEAFEHSFFFSQGCPASTQVGTLTLDTTLANITLPVFNLEPPPGVPARLGVFAVVVPVIMEVSIRTGGDYGLTVELRNLPQFLPVVGGSLALWGVPAEESHDSLRGNCLRSDGSSGGECPSGTPRRPFITLPGVCGESLQAKVLADSWESPGAFVEGEALTRDGKGDALSLAGCDSLDFSPTVEVQSESAAADTPSALAVDLHMPLDENPDGLAEALVRNAAVKLPPGVSIDPAAADGLGACRPREISLDSAAPPACPDSSRIGSVSIDSPLLTGPLQGSIYLAAPHDNAFGSMLAVYIAGERDGVLVKLAGRIDADAETGRLTLALDGLPQLPFSELRFVFDGGPRAPLATPAQCGVFTTSTRLNPYSAPDTAAPRTLSNDFFIDRGCDGGFSPSFLAGATSSFAGRDTGFTVQVARADGEPSIRSLSTTLPRGVLARLGGVSPCAAAQAAAGECGPASRIGSISVAAGAGSHPFYLPGQVFLTGPYDGAPFGLSIVVPGIAGPFDLGTIVVRATVSVDPRDAHLTIATDSLPQILQGIPLRIRALYLTIDRPGFMLAPTSCERQRVSAAVLDDRGADALVTSPFSLAGCAGLPFSPRVSASTTARVTRAGGAAFEVAIRNPQGAHANIRAISVGFPKQFSPRLTAIQAACPGAAFAADPASCPPASIVGRATVQTPILGVALRGPAYLVSGGNDRLPRLALVLQGQGVELWIAGSLRVSGAGAIAATFGSMPDTPISKFVLRLPRGSRSALGASFLGKAAGSLCGRNLTMSTRIVSQSGRRLARSTRVRVIGCSAERAPRHGG